MNKYIKQFYTEGLGYMFYKRPIEFLRTHIKNPVVYEFLVGLITVLYTVLALAFAAYMFYEQFSLK